MTQLLLDLRIQQSDRFCEKDWALNGGSGGGDFPTAIRPEVRTSALEKCQQRAVLL